MSSETKSTFFKQSIWMVGATFAGGVFMSLVHTVTAKMDPAEYGVFFTLLRCLLLLSIPATGLQTVFAQQAAAAVSEDDAHRLTRTTKALLSGVFFIWLAMAVGVFFAQPVILEKLKISTPAALWVTMLVVLASLWLPIYRGLLQGKQHFSGLGWVMILDGVGRFAAVCVIILFLKGQAAGGMVAALIGQFTAIAVAAWLTRSIWRGTGLPFEWRAWFGKVVPLTLGMGALVFMQNSDVPLVQSIYSEDDSPFYMPAAMVGFALVQFTGPLVAVMFPKIVRSVARAEKTDVQKMTFLITAAAGGFAALIYTVFPELPLRILYFTQPKFWKAAAIVPWFGWAMLFMMLSNVLVGNLLAREKFAVVPWLVIVAVAYGVTLYFLRTHLPTLEVFAGFQRLVQVLAGFNLLLLLVSSWFTWGRK